ncbi:hypothetical protein JX265_002504 [Neoarthrinium moseri]|uniref:Gas1-like protein n=1 Tax=Neoarthrinium moseri TaxID=1658444 RepID=A0A9P9WV25_9PEZI|nr:uncharacterized protein JN550_000318 [Neoarthrinium moseri]KAI1854865.1 hypothetical protein JX266_000983 [Neoarthrinium moseri]KAI1878136.1 hypothetical protein JN550_000318 [Neoarthrinium moseri]KAI1879550.1 hypothetical protein JX265_002504 [Neoarthrinium moseri]
MPSLYRACLAVPAFLALAHAQAVIVSAKGDKGTSLPLQVDTTKSDANVINTQEITDNVVNECGRTLLAGNIDIGEQTEIQLSNKTVTQVTKGSKVAVTINQLTADGAGPFTCDMDQASNIQGATGQTPLDVTEKDAGNGVTQLTVTMPQDMTCIGASTGNVCTVRCFNAAKAGPFGGCFAVQQTDVTPNQNTPQNIATAQTLQGITAQVLQNQKDLGVAVKANADAPTQADQGVLAVDELLNTDSKAQATAGAANATGRNGQNKNARAFAA